MYCSLLIQLKCIKVYKYVLQLNMYCSKVLSPLSEMIQSVKKKNTVKL